MIENTRGGGKEREREREREKVVIKKQVAIQTDVFPPLKEAGLFPNQVGSRRKTSFSTSDPPSSASPSTPGSSPRLQSRSHRNS